MHVCHHFVSLILISFQPKLECNDKI